jgi:hypothetical protein
MKSEKLEMEEFMMMSGDMNRDLMQDIMMNQMIGGDFGGFGGRGIDPRYMEQ